MDFPCPFCGAGTRATDRKIPPRRRSASVDAKGESRISVEDYAVAMLDELEQPKHVRQRFTVGY